MKKINLLFFIFIWSIGNVLFAQTEKAITLSEAIQMGLENNYQIKIAEKQVAIAQNNNVWQNTGRYPSVDFNLRSNNSFTRSNNPASFIPEVSNISGGITPSIDGRWTIFDGFKVDINKTRLEELELQSKAQIGVAIENNIQAIMLSYYQA